MANPLRQPLLVLTFICAAFTCVASAVVLALSVAGHVDSDAVFSAKLVVRIALFGGLAACAAFLLWRDPSPTAVPEQAEPPHIDWRLAFIPCAVAAAVAFPRLGATPHVEPDEWHHLNVAHNLAVHGLYASGSEEEGFTMFDDYDSVGPPVILPVAAAMRIAGSTVESARIVMALFFIGLAFTVFWFCAPAFGGWAAVFASLLAIGAWGSAYLARTLYGEVPALLFLLLALIAARASLKRTAIGPSGLLAGACFGLAVLCKYYLLMAAWPLLGALILDRITAKRVRVPHVIAPAIGTFAVLATWSFIQTLAERDVSNAANGQLSMYQHNLLFGIEGLSNTAGLLLTHSASAIALAAGLIYGAMLLRKHLNDPTVAALWFFAAFQWYWWLFFNTGNLPRYSWYGWAATAVFLGPLLKMLIDAIAQSNREGRLTRPIAVACCAAIVAPAAIRTAKESQRAWLNDEMRHTRDLAAYVATRPEQERIATTFWPLERSVQFLSGRTVARLRTTDAATEYDVLLIDAASNTHGAHGPNAKRFGPYAAVTVPK